MEMLGGKTAFAVEVTPWDNTEVETRAVTGPDGSLKMGLVIWHVEICKKFAYSGKHRFI